MPHENNKILGRLKNRTEFLRVRKGQKIRGKNFFIERALRQDGSDNPRYGLTVSKKCGNAPQRNRIKRRLRHALEVHVAPHLIPSMDYVIVAHREIISMPFQKIVTQLTCCVNSAS
jgi:ribonuclease P protein component